ncbi:MAG TPA: hypothetical protein VGL58_03135 [Caulobacteraceae bacterium]|jgi:hypothetical protein
MTFARTTALPASKQPIPGYQLLYAFGAAIAVGLPLGFFHAPYWPVVVLGVIAAAGGLWLEREPIKASTAGRSQGNVYGLLAIAYVFVAIICIGCVAVGDFVGEWLRLKV